VNHILPAPHCVQERLIEFRKSPECRTIHDRAIMLDRHMIACYREPTSRRERYTEQEIEGMSIEELLEIFMLVPNYFFEEKQKRCDTCRKTNQRQGPTDEISDFFNSAEDLYIKMHDELYFFEGDEEYTDDVGCAGCIWAYPTEWYSSLYRDL